MEIFSLHDTRVTHHTFIVQWKYLTYENMLIYLHYCVLFSGDTRTRKIIDKTLLNSNVKISHKGW